MSISGFTTKAAARVGREASPGKYSRLLNPIFALNARARGERAVDRGDITLSPARNIGVSPYTQAVKRALNVGIDIADEFEILTVCRHQWRHARWDTRAHRSGRGVNRR